MKAISKATLKHSKQMRLGFIANINFCLTDETKHSGPNVKSWGLFSICLVFLKGPIFYSSSTPAKQPLHKYLSKKCNRSAENSMFSVLH